MKLIMREAHSLGNSLLYKEVNVIKNKWIISIVSIIFVIINSACQ